jgi:hypothetical protein
VIPWAASAQLGLDQKPFMSRRKVIWSGPLGSAGIRELMISAVAMIAARVEIPEMDIAVWPKPEFLSTYAPVAAQFGPLVEAPGNRFSETLGGVRVLVSPVNDPSCIIRPPLTWLEAISCGCSIVTTPCVGIDESWASGRVIVADDDSSTAVAGAIAVAWALGPRDSKAPSWTADDARDEYIRLWKERP